jgi:fructose-bisphosphate aldolase class II
MPLATAAQSAETLDATKAGGYAIPAVNVTSSTTLNAAFDFVFHGGSGLTPGEIVEAVGHGVVKMNLDTDAHYASTCAVADHTFVNKACVVRADCSIGDKHACGPRTWSRCAEHATAARVVEACRQLGSAGTGR